MSFNEHSLNVHTAAMTKVPTPWRRASPSAGRHLAKRAAAVAREAGLRRGNGFHVKAHAAPLNIWTCAASASRDSQLRYCSSISEEEEEKQ